MEQAAHGESEGGGVKTKALAKPKRLTSREKRFVDAFFVTTPIFNGSEAARAVGFSEKSCRVAAVRLLTKDNIKAAIEQRKLEIEEASKITREAWLKKAERFYHGDVRKMFDDHGNVIDIPTLEDNEASLIAGFEVVEEFTQVEKADGKKGAEHTGYTKKFKLVDPLKAHEYYGKITGFYTEKREITGTLTVEHLVTLIQRKEPKVING